METKGIVFDIKRFALNDGPGLRTTVFFKGCPLFCSWCHNPESRAFEPVLLFRPARCVRCLRCVEACPANAVAVEAGLPVTDPGLCTVSGKCAEVCPSEAREIVGREYSVLEIMEEIRKDRVFYEESGGGVTFSGGEPLAQPEFLAALLRVCRDEGIHCTLDTSGFAENKVFLKTASLADLVLFDLKAIDPETHLRLTGVYNKEILENVVSLSAGRTEILIRIPLIPGLNDDERNITRTGEFVLGLPKIPGVELLPYHPVAKEKHERFSFDYLGPEAEVYPVERVDEAERILSGMGLSVIRRDRD
jgi:pyruvate formate lyase activating enzyme